MRGFPFPASQKGNFTRVPRNEFRTLFKFTNCRAPPINCNIIFAFMNRRKVLLKSVRGNNNRSQYQLLEPNNSAINAQPSYKTLYVLCSTTPLSLLLCFSPSPTLILNINNDAANEIASKFCKPSSLSFSVLLFTHYLFPIRLCTWPSAFFSLSFFFSIHLLTRLKHSSRYNN
jgi:hypothetical protein